MNNKLTQEQIDGRIRMYQQVIDMLQPFVEGRKGRDGEQAAAVLKELRGSRDRFIKRMEAGKVGRKQKTLTGTDEKLIYQADQTSKPHSKPVGTGLQKFHDNSDAFRKWVDENKAYPFKRMEHETWVWLPKGVTRENFLIEWKTYKAANMPAKREPEWKQCEDCGTQFKSYGRCPECNPMG